MKGLILKILKQSSLSWANRFLLTPKICTDITGHIYQKLSILYYFKGGETRVGSKIRGKYTRSYPESEEVYDRLFFLESGFYECTKDLSYIYHDVTHYCPIPDDLTLEGYELSMNDLELREEAEIEAELEFERIQSMACVKN